MRREEINGNVAAFMTILVWGVTFVSTKELLVDFSPPEILVIRFSLGWLALCLVSRERIAFAGFKLESLFAFAGFTGVTLYFLLENIALVYTLASNVGVIVAISPFFTAILAWKMLEAEKPKVNFYIGFIIAIIGISMISWHGKQFKMNPFGDILAIFAALTWAAYSVATKKLSMYGYGSLAATRRIFFYGLLFMAPLLFLDNFSIRFTDFMKPVNIANILFLGLGASAICFATWTYTLKCLGAARASVYIYLVPVVSIISAAIILHEPLTYMSIIGSAMAISGLAVSQLEFGKRTSNSQN